MEIDCLVLVPEVSQRVTYTFKMVLEENLGLKTGFTDNPENYLAFEGIKINYTIERRSEQEVFLPSCGLLLEEEIRQLEIDPDIKEDIPYFFPVEASASDCKYDLPAMIFFMLSRYEEYWLFEGDRHGRFAAGQSLASKYGFLRIPVVNIWINLIKEQVRKKYPGAGLLEKKYHFQPTYDVDMAWAFRNRGLRSAGGWVKDFIKLNFKNIRQRQLSISDKAKDPFYTFGQLEDLHRKNDLHPYWFFLMGNYGGVDKSISWKKPEFRELIGTIAQPAFIGIHPSIASNENFDLLEREIFRLGVIKKSPVHRSRQHYLMLSFPETYKNLLRAGIREDFSLGYADDIGFRAGFAGDFFWYDLEAETPTTLRIYPFQVMDVTLKNYLQLTPREAMEEIDDIVQQVKLHGGTFISLWHNSSFAASHGWEGWFEVY